ncbi:MAG: D-alanine--D-alanine ligase family protein [Bacillota bacterium]|nr:D-alanine--D-alanine ligase family protein [Bacillota bacterium]
MKRKRVAVIFGGRSGEHVVSLRSAASIMDAIDKDAYEVIPIGITRKGTWLAGPDVWSALWESRSSEHLARAVLVTDPAAPGLLIQNGSSSGEWIFQRLDLVFPILHGTYGEDGTIQGLLEMAGLPYVGAGVLASSVAMDKAVMKILFEHHALPVASYLYFNRSQWKEDHLYWQERIEKELGYPCFVKPANLGSSVGVSKIHDVTELTESVEAALLYDDKVVVEAYVEGRELECSVLGDINPVASRPGEVVPCNEFYDYRAKYVDDRSELIIPVELEEQIEKKIREYSIKAFLAVEASGLARVDFFLQSHPYRLLINEINTMPGFTSISMYPKLWEASGIKYCELIGRLLEMAEERFKRKQSLLFVPPE